MNRYLTTPAIVLKQYPLKDNDKIIVFLTQNNGIIKCVAKYLRTSKSKIKGSVLPFMYINAQFYKGKSELYILKDLTVEKPYSKQIVSNYDLYTVSNILIELSEKLNYFSQNTSSQFLLLKGALDEIDKKQESTKIILNAFFIKSLYLGGINPILNKCVYCQKKIDTKIINFSNKQGGIICDDCQIEHNVIVKKVKYEVIELIALLVNSNWQKAKVFNDNIQKNALDLLTSFTQYQLENKIKSLKYLNIYESKVA
jgi:DNA repair protein RecO (recombination protein O)